MGRLRKPTAQKIYEGNPGKRKIVADDFEPEGVPVKPQGMSPSASWLWDFLVPELVEKGIAKRCDTPALIGLCVWWGRYQAAESALAADGVDQFDERLVNAASKAWAAFERMAARFGLTPSARAGLKLDANKKPDALTDFLSRGKCLKN